jgi:pyrophosphatase PpaX
MTPHAADPPRTAVLLDLDGTLVDTIPLILDAIAVAFTGRTPAPTRTEWLATLGRPLHDALRDWVAESDLDTVIARYRARQRERLHTITHPYDGIADALAACRRAGHALAIVTSKGRDMTARTLDQVGLTGAVDLVVTADDTTRHKPHAEPIWHALATLGWHDRPALYLGDAIHDLHAAHAAGVHAAAAGWGPFDRTVLAPGAPDSWLDHPRELPALADRLAHAPPARPARPARPATQTVPGGPAV